MLPSGTPVVVDFRLADINSNPVPGRTLSAWRANPNHVIFLRNMQDCQDTLNLHDYGDGRYSVSYTPSSVGHDYLEIYDEETDINIIYTEDIIPADFATGTFAMVTLNQDYGGSDVLRISVENPTAYTLYLFRVSDWDQNLRTTFNAVGVSALDVNGRWMNSIQVVPGYYNVVIRSTTTTTIVRYNLQAS